jgi:hypothetical protein
VDYSTPHLLIERVEPIQKLLKDRRTMLGVGLGLLIVGVLVIILRPDPLADLDPGKAELSGLECGVDFAAGSVVNEAEVDATPVIEVTFLDESGSGIQKGSVTVPGLAPGETAGWRVPFREDLLQPGTSEYVDCTVEVSVLFRFDSGG